jgi:hypothetical protein
MLPTVLDVIIDALLALVDFILLVSFNSYF